MRGRLEPERRITDEPVGAEVFGPLFQGVDKGGHVLDLNLPGQEEVFQYLVLKGVPGGLVTHEAADAERDDRDQDKGQSQFVFDGYKVERILQVAPPCHAQSERIHHLHVAEVRIVPGLLRRRILD
ncbi:MAG: hypothetical protein COW52_01735, partial [Nitrospirae bacterium CG17_big_fil_post_rev_8_21_14_2_50_50_9]